MQNGMKNWEFNDFGFALFTIHISQTGINTNCFLIFFFPIIPFSPPFRFRVKCATSLLIKLTMLYEPINKRILTSAQSLFDQCRANLKLIKDSVITNFAIKLNMQKYETAWVFFFRYICPVPTQKAFHCNRWHTDMRNTTMWKYARSVAYHYFNSFSIHETTDKKFKFVFFYIFHTCAGIGQITLLSRNIKISHALN